MSEQNETPAAFVRPTCARRAKWEVSGPLVALHFCCDEHKEQWERLTAGWRTPLTFVPIHTYEMRCAV